MLKRSALLLVNASAAIAAIAADVPSYNFDLTVRVGSGEPVHVQAAVLAGTSRVVAVSPALQFDLTAPADGKSLTIVTLLDISGGDPTVLHTAQRGGPASLVRTSAYTVCDGLVKFQYFESPTQVLTAKCRE
jgi:hypothetical protein